MKKLKKHWLFLMIIGISLSSLAIAWLLEKEGLIIWPEIKTIKFSEDDQLVFKIYQLSLPMNYSRLWDAFILPIFLSLIISQGIKAHRYASIFILTPVLLTSLAMGYFFGSEIISLISGLTFILICGIFFSRRYILFLSLLLGLLIGLSHLGLLHGFILAMLIWPIILALRATIQ
jgi:hypothetical protein